MSPRKADRPPRIGLISPCGGGNLGDAAIVAATIEGIRSRIATASVFAMTFRPNDTERRHRIPAFRLSAERYELTDGAFAAWGSGSTSEVSPRLAWLVHLYPVLWFRPVLKLLVHLLYFAVNVRNELRHVIGGFKLAHDTDLLIVAGGGQLDDYWGGAWSHPYNLLKWSCIARAAGTPLAMLSVGYGTAASRLSRLFLRTALRMSAYSTFRDPRTASVARECLGQPDSAVVPDLAFGLAVATAPSPLPERRPIVGISPIAYADPRSWPEKDAARYDQYLGRLARFVDWLGERGHELVLFCTDTMDVHCLRDLHARCTVPLNILTTDIERPQPYYKEVDELLAQLTRCDLIVASRLHGVILAHRLAKPVLAVSYDWKVDVHMAQVGESENVLDIRSMETATLVDGFGRLAQRQTEIERKLTRTVAEFGRQVSAQFDLVDDRFLRNFARPARD